MASRNLFAFGFGGDGQLGNRIFMDNTNENCVRTPQIIVGAPTGPYGVCVKAIATGEKHTLFLADDGKVWSCGSNHNGELGRAGSKEGSFTIYPVHLSVGVTIIQIAAGRSHSMAVSDDGRLFAWGSNSAGQLGLPDHIVYTDSPKRVRLTEAVQVACGAESTIIIVESGRIFVWGRQPDGRVLYTPKEIEYFMALPVIQVSAGNEHYAALTTSGAVFVWGKNDYGQLGTSDNQSNFIHACSQPQEMESLQSVNVVNIGCGWAHTVALTYEGRLFACGDDSFGQLGDGRKYPSSNCMHAVTDLLGSHVSQVACGRCHTIALASGKLYSFGLNSSGQLGTGNARNQITPRPIDTLNSIACVFAGWDQTFCIQAKHIDEVSSGPSCFLQTPKFLSLRRVRELFAAGEKLSVIGELESVFSSLASINGSFLLHGDQRFRCGSSHSCVDMDGLALANRLIAESPDAEQYAELIMSNLDTSGIWDHPWERSCSYETIRVFLIIPSLYFFSSPSFDVVKSFHLRYVRAVRLLHKRNYLALGKWWSFLEPRHFNRLVTSLLSGLQILIEHDSGNSGAMNFCEVLSTLNDINVASNKVALDKFYITNWGDINIANDYVNWSFNNENTAAFSWSNYPFLMNADVKSMLMHLEARVQMQISMSAGPVPMFPFAVMLQPDPFFTIHVNRDRIVDDAMVALLSCRTIDLKKPLKVTFVGEEGDDAGGIKKEFFMLLFQELLQAKYGMFAEYEETHLIWFSGVECDPLSFKLTGMLCALAIYNNVLVDFPFPLALYKKILRKPIALEDLSELSPTEGRSLQSLLDYDGEDFEEVFDLTFVMNLSMLGESKEVELKPNGANSPVTQMNKCEYVMLYVAKKLEEGNDGEIKRQLQSFEEGFQSVIHSKILKFFQPQELMEMVIGNENYDWSIFRKIVDYKGVYHPNHEAIRCFWDVFFELNLDQRKQFLQFLMGSTRVPLQGMSALKMTIQPSDPSSLPVAHTCFNILDLPNISNHEEMKRRLLICLENTHGFTLA